MKNLIIILSKNENFIKSALKIKEQSKINTKILFIEDIVLEEINNEDIIYFLCNSPLIPDLIKKIENLSCTIFNKKYFINNYSKYQIQLIMKNNDILVPNIIDYEMLESIKFPIFCKENKHVGILFKAYNIETLKKIFSNLNKDEFYFEEDITLNKTKTTEFKVYYVNNKCFYKDNEKVKNNELLKICKNISSLLGLDIFSADFIDDGNSNYLIDVNSSAGFYLSNDARYELIKCIERI